MSHFVEWVRKLPETQPPHWLGLPRNAEKLLKASRGRNMLSKVRKMSSLSGQDDIVLDDAGTKVSTSSSSSLPSWMIEMSGTVDRWIEMLPRKLSYFPSCADDKKSPFYRFFERENEIASHLLKSVCRDLSTLSLICKGEMKQTNHTRSLIGALTKGTNVEYL